MSKRLKKACMAVVAIIAVVFLGSVLTGCGRGGPSDPEIQKAVRAYYEQTGIGVPDDFVKVPTGKTCLREGKEEVTFTEVRVVKRGKPFEGMSATGTKEALPVRIHVKGTTQKRYGAYDANGMMKNIKKGDLPFDGEVDFQISFTPPDKSKVDPVTGEWVAVPAL